jgi:hypothetical protein
MEKKRKKRNTVSEMNLRKISPGTFHLNALGNSQPPCEESRYPTGDKMWSDSVEREVLRHNGDRKNIRDWI